MTPPLHSDQCSGYGGRIHPERLVSCTGLPVKRTGARGQAAATCGNIGNTAPNPVDADFEPIVLTGMDEGSRQVVAEVGEVLGGGSRR